MLVEFCPAKDPRNAALHAEAEDSRRAAFNEERGAVPPAAKGAGGAEMSQMAQPEGAEVLAPSEPSPEESWEGRFARAAEEGAPKGRSRGGGGGEAVTPPISTGALICPPGPPKLRRQYRSDGRDRWGEERDPFCLSEAWPWELFSDFAPDAEEESAATVRLPTNGPSKGSKNAWQHSLEIRALCLEPPKTTQSHCWQEVSDDVPAFYWAQDSASAAASAPMPTKTEKLYTPVGWMEFCSSCQGGRSFQAAQRGEVRPEHPPNKTEHTSKGPGTRRKHADWRSSSSSGRVSDPGQPGECGDAKAAGGDAERKKGEKDPQEQDELEVPVPMDIEEWENTAEPKRRKVFGS